MTGEIINRFQDALPHDGGVVHVCGLGGVGKTQFGEALKRTFGGVIVASDWYLTYSSKVRRNRIKEALGSGDALRIKREENPKNWYDWSTLTNHLGKLSAGLNVDLPNAWNQTTGEKDLNITLTPERANPIWCDGIYLLHHPIIDVAKLSVLLTASPAVVRERAESRDSLRSSSEYLAYKETLRQRYDIPYFEAHQAAATIVIDNSDFSNPSLLR